METREIYELAKKSYPNFMIAVETEEGFVFYNDEKDAWRIRHYHAEFRGEEETEDSGDTYTISHDELRELMPYFNQAEGLRVLTCKEEEGEIVVRELVVNRSVSVEEMGRIKKEKVFVLQPHFADGKGEKEWCDLLKIALPDNRLGEQEELARTITRWLRDEWRISVEEDKMNLKKTIFMCLLDHCQSAYRMYGELDGKPTEFHFGTTEKNGTLLFCVETRNTTYSIGEEEIIIN